MHYLERDRKCAKNEKANNRIFKKTDQINEKTEQINEKTDQINEKTEQINEKTEIVILLVRCKSTNDNTFIRYKYSPIPNSYDE